MDSKQEEFQKKVVQQQNSEDNRNMERLALFIYSIHHICILGTALVHHDTWSGWAPAVIVTLFLASWIVYIRKYQDMHRRIAQYSIMVLASLTIFSVHAQSIEENLLQFASIVIVMGVAGFSDYIYIALSYLAINVGYHLFVGGTVHISSLSDAYHLMIPIANTLLIIVMVFFWVNKRKVSASAMMRVISELKRAERSKDDFMANVSHEIRTPINTINGMSDILLQETEPSKMLEEIQAIQVAGNSLMGVVSDILDFTELQSGRVEVVNEPYNITSTVNDIINMTNGSKSRKQLEFIVDVDANIPKSLMGDEKKIRRVILNLLNNAFKFTNDGGVQLSVGFRRESYGINLLITVKDTGIGMDQKSVENLFSSYNQVDTGRTRKKGGIGLGLAISNSIVRAMGGVMSVKSQLGNGTTMCVAIPQKVIDDRPIVHIENPETIKILTYVDVERFAMSDVRDSYNNTLKNMALGLGVSWHNCRNLAEVKRRLEREDYTHLFLAMSEYQSDLEYFDELAKNMCVAVLFDRNDERKILNPNILQLYKPLCILSVMSVINGHRSIYEINRITHVKSFLAPGVEVLVVDDNLMNIRVVEGLLSKYEIHVTRALSGYEALEKIYDKKYDIIFMDHMMPEMDGIETMHRIRELGGSYCSTVPIVALTANAISGAREMLLAEGFNDFQEKPVEMSSLERLLLRTLPPERIVELDPEEAKEEESIINAAVENSLSMQNPRQDTGISGNVTVKDVEDFQGSRRENLQGGSTPEEAEMAEEMSEPEFRVGDLDVETGMLYCGGRELYLNILREYAQKRQENYEPIQELFEQQDWKNYIIAVHAIKSSMYTIGAVPLSEMAKKLEMEGKAGNYEYILKNHGDMVQEYKRVIAEIAECPFVEVPAWEQGHVDKPDLSDSQFDEKAIAFENAMYALDGSLMLQIVEELSGYSYHGQDMGQELAAVYHKVEMSDYMSAVETLVKIKTKMRSKG